VAAAHKHPAGSASAGSTADRAPVELSVGDSVELVVGAVAHGGHCVARHEGRVVFVRHALPGERIRAVITEAKPGSFARADAVEILVADEERVSPPCAHFHPGGCGGCDFQHASAALQRRLKADVLSEQLHRLGGIDRHVEVEQLPGGGFGWRTRVRWGVTPEAVGPRRYRSAEVVRLSLEEPCLIAAPGITEAALDVSTRSPEVALTLTGDGEIVATPVRGLPGSATGGTGGSVEPEAPAESAVTVVEDVLHREFRMAADGFWQVHPGAPEALVDAVLEALPADATGSVIWDLYAGVGLFPAFLGEAVGPTGRVVAVESDARAVRQARANLADLPHVQIVQARVEKALTFGLGARPDVVVLDPPRTGVGRAVCDALSAVGPAVIIYVACDPAALARDTKTLLAAGYELASLRAFDAFPQTHHIEAVAQFTR
jgi:tRNA/tmRNA/rRNA uracil-C5-methylase (TrmA/RlmC/RlmD family)